MICVPHGRHVKFITITTKSSLDCAVSIGDAFLVEIELGIEVESFLSFVETVFFGMQSHVSKSFNAGSS